MHLSHCELTNAPQIMAAVDMEQRDELEQMIKYELQVWSLMTQWLNGYSVSMDKGYLFIYLLNLLLIGLLSAHIHNSQ